MFLGIPRIWEKIGDALESKMKLAGSIKLKLLNWAQKIGREETPALIYGKKPSPFYYMANTLVFNKIKKQIGFDKCKIFLTGAAPLSNRLQEFFMGIGMPLFEAYGMSETSGAFTVNLIGQ